MASMPLCTKTGLEIMFDQSLDITPCNMPQKSNFLPILRISDVLETKHYESKEDLLHLDGGNGSFNLFVRLLRESGNKKTLSQGKRIHSHILKHGLNQHKFLADHLIGMYHKCGSLLAACCVVEQMSNADVVSWTGMIGIYVHHGHCKEALQVFCAMHEQGIMANQITYVTILNICSQPLCIALGKLLHAQIIQRKFHLALIICNALIKMYTKCENLRDACALFNRMILHNAISWTAIIGACTIMGHGSLALCLSLQMQEEGIVPNKVTYVCLLDTCASFQLLAKGKQIHSQMLCFGISSDVFVGTSLVHMYGKCGNLKDSVMVFLRMYNRNPVSWTAMIGSHGQNGNGMGALYCFYQMLQEGMSANKISLVTIIEACTKLANLAVGKMIHAIVVVNGLYFNTIIVNALISMYGTCCCLEGAYALFIHMSQQNVISYTALIVAYSQNGNGKMALQLFHVMADEYVNPDKVMIVSTLDACTSISDWAHGKFLHAYTVNSEHDSIVETALVNMCSKCGSLHDACWVFDKMYRRNVVSWNCIIASYAQHGHGYGVIKLLLQMQQEGLTPDECTFIGILSACSYAGLLDEAFHYHVSLVKDYDMTPAMEHYGCLVDLLGRAGHLEETQHIIKDMPLEPDVVVWMSFLSSSRTFDDKQWGMFAAEHALELDPLNAGPYVTLSNIHAV